MANSTITPVWTKCIEHMYFSIRHMIAFLCWGILDSTSTLYLGAIFNSEIANKSKKMQKYDAKYTMKRTLVDSMRAEIKRQAWPCAASAGQPQCGRATQSFCCSVHIHVCRWPQKTESIDFCGYKLILASRQIHQYGICK